MSQPEISHRCESCGASIREQAIFCPECGRSPAGANAASSRSNDEKAPATVAAESAEVESSAAALETDKAAASDDQSTVKADPVPTHAKSEGRAAASQTAGKPGTYGKARDSLHRAGSAATSVARHALDDNVKRVEKIRHVSSAMIEEASYDPSLRFVLVALGLFVVFLVLLLLSKVMG